GERDAHGPVEALVGGAGVLGFPAIDFGLPAAVDGLVHEAAVAAQRTLALVADLRRAHLDLAPFAPHRPVADDGRSLGGRHAGQEHLDDAALELLVAGRKAD